MRDYYSFTQALLLTAKTLNASTALVLSIFAMSVVIVSSNILVRVPINDWLTWGTLTFPFAFVITDLMNRYFGLNKARQLVYAGFAIGIAASFLIAYLLGEPADIRVALASGTAFLISQLMDVSVFDKLRSKQWWIAPFTSSVISTVFDTFLFYALAFVGTGLVWQQWAVGDLGVKWLVALVALVPYGLLTGRTRASDVVSP